MTTDHHTIDDEHLPGDGPLDETDVSLRAYLASRSESHLREYDQDWTDEQVIAWDGNFRNDGELMLVCCERDVDIHEFRRILDRHLQYRFNSEFQNPVFRFGKPLDVESNSTKTGF